MRNSQVVKEELCKKQPKFTSKLEVSAGDVLGSGIV